MTQSSRATLLRLYFMTPNHQYSHILLSTICLIRGFLLTQTFRGAFFSMTNETETEFTSLSGEMTSGIRGPEKHGQRRKKQCNTTSTGVMIIIFLVSLGSRQHSPSSLKLWQCFVCPYAPHQVIYGIPWGRAHVFFILYFSTCHFFCFFAKDTSLIRGLFCFL